MAETPERVSHWLLRNVAWLATLALFLLVALVLIRVSRGNLTTALGLFTLAGPVNVAVAVLIRTLDLVVVVLATAFALMASDPSVSRAGRAALWLAYLTTALVGALAIEWTLELVIVLSGLVTLGTAWVAREGKAPAFLERFLEGLPLVGRAFATPPELAAISDRLEKLDEGMRRRDEKAAELDVASEEAVRELEGLVAEGEQAAAEVAGIQAAVVELERRQGAAAHDTVVIVRVMMVFIWVVGLLLLGLRSDVWLPPERFTFLTKRAPIVAYDLGQSNGDWISLLGDKRRLLVRVRVSDVASREFCRKERPARTRTFVQLFTGGPSGPDYPLCYPPHRTK